MSRQKKAVEAALTHQASIIQGPPGTGKKPPYSLRFLTEQQEILTLLFF